MASTSNLVITNTGLSKVSCELINKRSYNPDLITKAGDILVTSTGLASAFSPTAYLYYTKQLFDSNTLQIRICLECEYKHANALHQTILSLINPLNTEQNLLFKLNENNLEVSKGSTLLFSIPILNLQEDDTLNINLLLSRTSYELVLIHNKARKKYYGNLNGTLEFSSYSEVLLGKDESEPSHFWYGLIDLTKLLIYNGDTLSYSPSNEANFRFNKILVSDGTIPLTDSTIPSYQHVYEFPLTEINRTSNNLLLVAKIDENVYLNINQIGLYATDGHKNFLFGLITGLTLQKEKDLGYDLTFIVNLDLSVVNTTVLPEIIIKKENYASIAALDVLKNTHAYTVIDMERAIERNATMLGYEPDEVMFRLLNITKYADKNYYGAHLYSRVVQSLHSDYERTYTGDGINIVGNPQVSQSIITDFSISDYAMITPTYHLLDSWEFEMSFEARDNARQRTLCSLCNSTGTPKLQLTIDNDNYMYAEANGVFSRKKLFKVPLSKKLFIKMIFNGASYLFYSKDENDRAYTKVASIDSTLTIGTITETYIGVLSTDGIISNPFYGLIDLKDITIVSLDGSIYSPSLITYRELELQDTYCFIDYPASFYKVKNLGSLGYSDITFYEGSITGNRDSINFSNSSGSSIVVKVSLLDGSNKIILLKTNTTSNENYFSLVFEEYTLKCNIYLSDEVVTLKKEYSDISFRELTDNPFVVTITCNNKGGSPVFSLYLNNEKVDEVEGANQDYLPQSAFKITNYEDEMQEAGTNVVQNLLTFKGILKPDEVHYLCTLLGVNF